MPIDIESGEWESSEEAATVREDTLQFLRENEDQAFHARELADELMGTYWENSHEEERIINEVGEDEFIENREEYGFDDSETNSLADSIIDQVETCYLRVVLHDLVVEGEVVAKSIDGEYTDIPHDFDTVAFYTVR